MFLKNKNNIFKIRRSKVTDYAALIVFERLNLFDFFCSGFWFYLLFIFALSPFYILIYIF